MIMTAAAVFTGCGDKESSGADDSVNTNTVEYFEKKLVGTFAGSNDTTYVFENGRVTQKTEVDGEAQEKSGSFSVGESDSDGDGENDSVSLRITINGHSSSYTLENDGDKVVMIEGSKKTTLTKQ